MGRIRLDHCAQFGVRETDDSVLTTREDIFRASSGVPCDMHGAFVTIESGVECTRERLRTSGRCHHRKVHFYINCRGWLALGCPHRSGRSWGSVTSVALLATPSVANGQEIALSGSPSSRKAFTPINTLDLDFYSPREVQLLRKLI